MCQRDLSDGVAVFVMCVRGPVAGLCVRVCMCDTSDVKTIGGHLWSFSELSVALPHPLRCGVDG